MSSGMPGIGILLSLMLAHSLAAMSFKLAAKRIAAELRIPSPLPV
jgi:hypothetical protein